MALVLSFAAGWVLAIVLWATGVMKFFDAFLITLLMLIIAAAVRLVVPYLPGNRRES